MPHAGEVSWGRFPYDKTLGEPGPEARPCLILAVFEAGSRFQVLIAYGTTKLHRGLKAGEFLIDDRLAMTQAGLTEETKFDLKNHTLLPYSDKWFEIAPGTGHPSPKMGDISLVGKHRFRAARAAANLDAILTDYRMKRVGNANEVLTLPHDE